MKDEDEFLIFKNYLMAYKKNPAQYQAILYNLGQDYVKKLKNVIPFQRIPIGDKGQTQARKLVRIRRKKKKQQGNGGLGAGLVGGGIFGQN